MRDIGYICSMSHDEKPPRAYAAIKREGKTEAGKAEGSGGADGSAGESRAEREALALRQNLARRKQKRTLLEGPFGTNPRPGPPEDLGG